MIKSVTHDQKKPSISEIWIFRPDLGLRWTPARRVSEIHRAGGRTKGVMADQPRQLSDVALQDALNDYGNATQLTTLLAWAPRMLYVFSNGRMGSLRFSGHREGKALASAAKVGDIDARTCGRDKFSTVVEAETAQIVAETSGDLSAEIDAYMNHIIMRSRMSQVGAADRLPVSSVFATALVVAIVVVVDWFLNEPLVARLGVAGYAVHITSILIALASLVFAHYVVAGTPPGRRNRSRLILSILAIVGFVLFIVLGAYLRTTDPTAAAEGDIAVGLDLPTPETTIGMVVLQFLPIGVMLGLMLFTTAVAALIALHNDTRGSDSRQWHRRPDGGPADRGSGFYRTRLAEEGLTVD